MEKKEQKIYEHEKHLFCSNTHTHNVLIFIYIHIYISERAIGRRRVFL